jgi:hypothetical protein
VTTDEIARLPLNSRNLLDVAVVAPGVRSYAVEGGRSLPAAGALSAARFVNLYIDGVEWKGISTGNLVSAPQSGSLVSQDAIREFRVLLNPYDVEFTRGASWVISAVTHQGGNELHGSLFDFGQNRTLVAKSAFQTVKPDYRRQQAGGTLRGPLVRDHLFFAASYEGQSTDNFIDVVPGRPAANPALWDRYAGTFRAPFRNRMYTLRLTAPLGRHTLDASWVGRDLSTESGFGVPSGTSMLGHDAAIVGLYRARSVLLRDTWANASLANELTLHLLANTQDESLLTPGTTFKYPSFQSGLPTYPTVVTERHVGISNKTSYTRFALGAEHVLKVGLELTSIYGHGFQPTNKDGFFMFATDTSSQPQTARIGVGFNDPGSTADASSGKHGWLTAAWLQDQVRPTPSLTITAGVRYDAEIHGLNQRDHAPWARDTTLLRVVGDRYLNDGDRTNDLNNFAPRLAVSWDIGGARRTFLRAGYRIMYERVPAFGAFSERLAWQWRIYSFTRPGTTDPAELRRRVAAGGGTQTMNLVLLPDHLETPSSRQWSVGIGRRLSDHATLNIDYLDQHLRNVYVTVRENIPNAAGQRPLTSRYGDILLWGGFGDATYRGVLASFSYDGAATHLSASYTLSWSASEFGFVMNADYPDSADYRLQRSEADERHRLVLAGFTELPFKLRFSTIAVVASPRPFLAFAGSDVNNNGATTDDWPSGRRTAYRGGWSNWYRTVDLRLTKSIRVSPGELAITAEVFNALSTRNHSAYQNVQSNLLEYRQPTGDYARRQAQLGIRYSF